MCSVLSFPAANGRGNVGQKRQRCIKLPSLPKTNRQGEQKQEEMISGRRLEEANEGAEIPTAC